ncbi:alpha-mannosidase [Jannaschia pagri]|uniref:Alpha-mannosidase n=1 Tax=Jannaschia pagri TaxID=2829797 RepID=A0ABQ4NJK8_9RHOB|nr:MULTISPECIES: glycoside hydrolase family 38 C-terminal domain-containing protein [unclassified Jannaschia]GIT90699.1 alpha-mannosidase [Jannaschia sp. AI_61]GIT94531.1 alpha-mannosidase [Jannaschia sp. AI_62]
MNHSFRLTQEKIAQRLGLIAPMAFRRRVPLVPFRLAELADAETPPPLDGPFDHWPEVAPDSYWGRCELNFLMRSRAERPTDFDPAHTALHLPLGNMGDIFGHPEALVYVNGAAIGSADRHHHMVPLPDGADTWDIALHGWTGLVGWPPSRDSGAKPYIGRCQIVERHPETEAFIALATAACQSVGVLSDDRPERHRLLNALDAAFVTLDTRDPMGDAFYDSLPRAMDSLRDGIARAGAPLDVTLIGIGHAHMDVAYLWPIEQIRRKNGRTYANALRLMDSYPDFRFSHSQPQLYAYTEQDYPDIFERIRQRVAEGRWEVMGGMWVEPDLNIPGPEALVRQLMLGRKYFRDRFGPVETPVLWLPDTFGFPWTIPQLMKHAGLQWFCTNKLNWNQTNRLPASTHWWEGRDGTRVLAHVLTTPRVVKHLPFPTNYKSDLSAPEVMGTWTKSTTKDKIDTLPICYGYGDGGGGPKEDLIWAAQAYAEMPGMPRLRMGTVRETFEALETQAADLPIWRGEHYMEGHRGVLTSQGWIKRANRQAETALHEAEALSAMAGLTPDLGAAWELLCLNQFHDILTGTSITEVFTQARTDFAAVREAAETATRDACKVLAGQGETPVALNTAPLPCDRFVVVPNAWAVDLEGQAVEGGTLVHLPAMAPYEARVIGNSPVPPQVTGQSDGVTAVLENDLIRVEIDAFGALSRVFDKEAQREVLTEGCKGNALQLYEDRPVSWDAWDIDPFFEDRLEPEGTTAAVSLVETGPLRAVVHTTRVLRNSRIHQRIVLRAGSKRIDFETEVDWRETHILLKVAFPVAVHSSHALYDIQWGTIPRVTHANTPFDAARFEVAGHKWADMAERGYGVALLNDCKYGYDVRDGVMRLSLIKSSTEPDPTADQGRHVFTYALLPHIGDRSDGVEAEAYDLNHPLRLWRGDGRALPSPPSVDVPNVTLRTWKRAEDGDGMILRLYEAQGGRGPVRVTIPGGIGSAEICDFHEVTVASVTHDERVLYLDVTPWEIVTLRIRP